MLKDHPCYGWTSPSGYPNHSPCQVVFATAWLATDNVFVAGAAQMAQLVPAVVSHAPQEMMFPSQVKAQWITVSFACTEWNTVVSIPLLGCSLSIVFGVASMVSQATSDGHRVQVTSKHQQTSGRLGKRPNSG